MGSNDVLSVKTCSLFFYFYLNQLHTFYKAFDYRQSICNMHLPLFHCEKKKYNALLMIDIFVPAHGRRERGLSGVN